MANYELMMILDPAIGEESLSATTDTVKKLLKDAKAKIVKEDVWGEKKLSYKIKGSLSGHYILWNLELDGKEIKAMNTQFNLEQNIWRYMFVNLDYTNRKCYKRSSCKKYRKRKENFNVHACYKQIL